MERWRVLVAILVTGAALPFLLRDDASSANVTQSVPADVLAAVETTIVPTTTTTSIVVPVLEVDPSAAAIRANSWYEAQHALNERNIQIALELVEEEERRVADFLDAVAATIPVETSPPTTKKPADATATTAPPATTIPPTTTEPPAEIVEAPAETVGSLFPPVSEVSAEAWEQLRQCESSGRYNATSPSGKFRGAYQFSVATWDWVAGVHHPWLVGVDPAAAAPAEQDAQAYALYHMRGAGQWPECGRFL